MSQADYHAEVHRGAAALATLREDWQELEQRVSDTTICSTWAAANGAWKMAGDITRPLIVTVRDDHGTLRGILPLGAERSGTWPLRYERVCAIAPGMLEENGVLCDASHRPAVVDCIAQWLADLVRAGTPVDIRPARRVDPLIEAAARASSRYHTSTIAPSRIASLEPAASWEDVLRDGAQRREIRRCQRRLHDHLHAQTVILHDDAELDRFALRFVDVHAREQVRKGRSSKYATATARRELGSFLKSLHASNQLEAMAIMAGDRLVAGYIFFRFRGCATGYRTTFDREFRSFGPGAVLLAAAVDRAIALGDREWSFSCGGDSYKNDWADPAEEYCRLIGVPRTTGYRVRCLLSRVWT